MEVHTNAPGLQLYTANFLDGTLRGKNGKRYQKWVRYSSGTNTSCRVYDMCNVGILTHVCHHVIA
jgi:hypothetical protein